MNRSRSLALIATLAVVASACSDASPTSPAAAPSLGWKSTSISGSGPGSIKTVTFTVYPAWGALVNIDEHRIHFQPYAICDMSRSSYGPEYWDAPCPLATRGVRITARAWHDSDGRPMVDFEPALRFNPNAQVTLYLRERSDASEPQAKIFYVSPDGTLVDESLTDASLVTRTAPNGFKYRRVKHFSGYLLSTGRLRLDEGGYGEYLRGDRVTDLELPQLNSGHVIATGAVSEGPAIRD